MGELSVPRSPLRDWGDRLLLGCWLLMGLALRFTHLMSKPAASTEISTLGFSLGQGFRNVPLNQLLSLDRLLSPLQLNPSLGDGDVVARLLNETNHPPLSFLLNHWWLRAWPHSSGLELLASGRSLSALLGAIAIPAVFGLSWFASRSRLAGHFAAALMAVSPYGIYLSQEARHYSLSILWGLASLACCIAALRCLRQGRQLSGRLIGLWVGVNGLGFVTHYFFSLLLTAEALVVAREGLGWKGRRSQPWSRRAVGSMALVALGTGLLGLGWLGLAGGWMTDLASGAAGAGVADSGLTDWIATDYRPQGIWLPIPRLLGWFLTMVLLLPVEGTPLGVTVASGLGLLGLVGWASPMVLRGWRAEMAGPNQDSRRAAPAAAVEASRNLAFADHRTALEREEAAQALQALTGVLVGLLGLFLVIIYGLGKDLSLAPRYSFVCFPGLIVLLGITLARCWQAPGEPAQDQPTQNQATPNQATQEQPAQPETQSKDQVQEARSRTVAALGRRSRNPARTQRKARRVVLLLLLVGGLGGLTVVNNYGYQKSQRADVLAGEIQASSAARQVVAMGYETHAELRALMAVGLELERPRLAKTVEEKAVASASPAQGGAPGSSPAGSQGSVQEELQFLLMEKPLGSEGRGAALASLLSPVPRPMELWTLKFSLDSAEQAALNCSRAEGKPSQGINGYRTKVYDCFLGPSD